MAVGNVGRITGLATGLDVDSVVKGMLTREQAKLDKIFQNQELLSLKQGVYRDLIKGIKEFQKYFDTTSEKYISSKDFSTTKLTISNESAVSISADSSAMAGENKVTINRLATKTTTEGSELAGVYKLEGTAKTVSVKDKDGNVMGDININADDTVDITGFEDDINVRVFEKGGEKFVKFENKTSETISLDDKVILDLDSSTKLTDLGIAKDTTISFTINSETVTFDVEEGSTLNDLRKTISTETGGKVTIDIDESLNRVNFVSGSTGSDTDFTLSADPALESALGINIGSKVVGQDAEVVLERPDGLKTTITSKTNSINEFGMSMNLKKADSTEEIIIDVDKKSNIDSVAKKINEFIKDYNGIMSTIREYKNAKKNYSYRPLTEEQKKDMSEEDINKWNEKVKGGILSGDSMLEKMFSDMRGIFSTQIDGAEANLGKYGDGAIGFDGFSSYTKAGEIEIDEIKLKEVLTNDPEKIEEFFMKQSDIEYDDSKAYVDSDKFKEDGIYERMNTIIKDYVGSPGIGDDGKSTLKGALNVFVNKQYDYSNMGTSSKNTLPDQIYRQKQAFDKMEKKMFTRQEALYLQFAKLEKAMSSLNSQSNFLTAQFAG